VTSWVQSKVLTARCEGSGTILEVLRLNKRLIVVANETLLDNHQRELADALSTQGHLVSSTVRWV
jgi:beta-1,4-N-acetylglucosaminyltransferase